MAPSTERPGLFRRLLKGDEEKVKLLLMGKCDSNVQDEQENTPLHLAAQNGHREVVELLLKSMVNPNLQNEGGKTGLHLAAQNGHD